MPRGGGKGGTLLRAHSFKLRHELEAFSFLQPMFRTRCFGGFCNKITHTTATRNVYWIFNFADEGNCALHPEYTHMRKQAGHKAKCYCEADARNDWPDCACIVFNFPELNFTIELISSIQKVCEGTK